MVWSMLERLGVAGIVNDDVGQRRSDAAASAGTYFALSVLNRVAAPCSKLAFADWWTCTCGDRIMKLPASALDHPRFWDAMDFVTEDQLVEIERRIVASMVESFGIDYSGLVLDMTNFATYIDSGNDRAPIAQRGHAKQKRTDLRLVGLGLGVSTDHGVPLVSHAYAGNRPDVTQFSEVVAELVQRFGPMAESGAELTLVYDAGQDSADTQELMEDSPLHSSGRCRRRTIPICWRWRCAATARSIRCASRGFGPSSPVPRCLAATAGSSSPTHRTCMTSRCAASSRPWARLAVSSPSLKPGKGRKSRAQPEAEVAQILKPRWLNRVISTTLTGEKPADLRLVFRTKPKALAEMHEGLFGKRILFTDRNEWSVAEVVAGYR